MKVRFASDGNTDWRLCQGRQNTCMNEARYFNRPLSTDLYHPPPKFCGLCDLFENKASGMRDLDYFHEQELLGEIEGLHPGAVEALRRVLIAEGDRIDLSEYRFELLHEGDYLLAISRVTKEKFMWEDPAWVHVDDSDVVR